MTPATLRLERADDPAPRLRIEGLAKAFGTRPVLRGVSLALAPGRVTALVGPNGAGKSTLVRIVLGLVRPDAGQLWLDGTPMDPRCPAHRAGIGYMPQQPSVPGHLTGREAIRLLASLRPEGLALDHTLIDRMGLGLDLDRPVQALSGGTRQKLNAVLAFLFAPSLLLLDEPTAGLDPLASLVLKDRVRELRDGGAAVLLSSHVLAELEDLADDVLVLLEGRVRFHGSVRELSRHTGTLRLERVLLGRRERRAEQVTLVRVARHGDVHDEAFAFGARVRHEADAFGVDDVVSSHEALRARARLIE